MPRWNPVTIAGGAYADDTRPWAYQDTVNYLPVPAERAGTRSAMLLRGAPGFSTFSASMQQAPVRGLHNVEGLLLAVTGNQLYRIGTDGAATAIGTVPGVGRVSIAHNQAAQGHQVMIANGQSGYVYNTFTGEFGQVSDDGFPGMKVADFVDGYIAGVDPQGRYWLHSAPRDATQYNTLDRYDAESAPDKIVTLVVSHREVLVLNQRSAGFFRNTGAVTGTFQNANGMEMDVGCAAPFAVAAFDNTVYWLGNDGAVYRLAGHQPQRISTGPIEQAISRCNMANAFAMTFEDRGHKVFYLTFPDGHTWGFDAWTGEWHRRQSQDLDRWRLSALVRWQGRWIGGDFYNGRLYLLDWAVQDEDGAELARRRIIPMLHDNANDVIVNALRLQVDTGLGNESSPRPAPILAPLSISGDLPDGFVGDSGTYQYTASGGLPPYGDFTIISGALPPGATMDATGLVTYEYSSVGDYTWTVQAVDANGDAATLADDATVSQVVWEEWGWLTADVPEIGGSGEHIGVWSPDLALLVHTDGGPSWSTDGLAWNAGAGFTNSYESAWSPSLQMFAGVRDGMRYVSSVDGKSWTQVTGTGAYYGASTITWADDIGEFYAIGGAGSNLACRRSSNGIDWTTSILGGNGPEYPVAVARGAGVYVVVCNESAPSNKRIGVSLDGNDWTFPAAFDTSWRDVKWISALGLFVAVGWTAFSGPSIVVSENGADWEDRTPVGLTARTSGVAYSPRFGLAITTNGSTTFLLSTDGGATFVEHATFFEGNYSRMIWCDAPLYRFVVMRTGSGAGDGVAVSHTYKVSP